MFILNGCEETLLIARWRPLLFFCQESTYGTHIHEKREEREARFCNTVHDIVNREGRCLIPVFALGRAQELLLILGEACWTRRTGCDWFQTGSDRL